jgi:hypothetical protein
VNSSVLDALKDISSSLLTAQMPANVSCWGIIVLKPPSSFKSRVHARQWWPQLSSGCHSEAVVATGPQYSSNVISQAIVAHSGGVGRGGRIHVGMAAVKAVDATVVAAFV